MNISNELLEQIELITTVNPVLVIDNGDGELIVYVFTQIEYSTNSSTSSIDYVSLRGYNITAFVNGNKISSQVDGINYLSRFSTFLGGRRIMSVKFNKNIKYMAFTNT
jgi:hypothetical protein